MKMWKIYALLTTAMLIWGFNSTTPKISIVIRRPRHHDNIPDPARQHHGIHHPGTIQTHPDADKNRMEIHHRRRVPQRRPPPLFPKHGTRTHNRDQRRTHPRNRPCPDRNLRLADPAQLPIQNSMDRRPARARRCQLSRPRWWGTRRTCAR